MGKSTYMQYAIGYDHGHCVTMLSVQLVCTQLYTSVQYVTQVGKMTVHTHDGCSRVESYDIALCYNTAKMP